MFPKRKHVTLILYDVIGQKDREQKYVHVLGFGMEIEFASMCGNRDAGKRENND